MVHNAAIENGVSSGVSIVAEAAGGERAEECQDTGR